MSETMEEPLSLEDWMAELTETHGSALAQGIAPLAKRWHALYGERLSNILCITIELNSESGVRAGGGVFSLGTEHEPAGLVLARAMGILLCVEDGFVVPSCFGNTWIAGHMRQGAYQKTASAHVRVSCCSGFSQADAEQAVANLFSRYCVGKELQPGSDAIRRTLFELFDRGGMITAAFF